MMRNSQPMSPPLQAQPTGIHSLTIPDAREVSFLRFSPRPLPHDSTKKTRSSLSKKKRLDRMKRGFSSSSPMSSLSSRFHRYQVRTTTIAFFFRFLQSWLFSSYARQLGFRSGLNFKAVNKGFFSLSNCAFGFRDLDYAANAILMS